MDRPPLYPGHGLNTEDERWGNRFSLVMSGVSIVLVVVLVLLAAQT